MHFVQAKYKFNKKQTFFFIKNKNIFEITYDTATGTENGDDVLKINIKFKLELHFFFYHSVVLPS